MLLLDRARYGLYPPGSTFKLVTAAAALRQGLNPSDTTFMCAYLPDGRVGARIAGWNRPVRDDVLDTHPHGTLACTTASCTRATRTSRSWRCESAPRRCSTPPTAGHLDGAASSVRRLRDTLPQAGYGQGDVVATPLRMARVAAAIANGGNLRDVSLDESGRAPAGGTLHLARRRASARALHARRGAHRHRAGRSAIIRGASPARPARRK